MRIVFAGTPEFAVADLQVLLDSGHEVVAVYTQPDRPAGRGRKLKASPVKELAQAAGIPVEQPASLKPVDEQQRLAEYRPDLMVVVAYGLLLPPAVLDIPTRGCVNVHASLLPRWRGAAPIQRAILAGDTETGVTLMQMEAGLDTGPMIASVRCPIGEQDNAQMLHDRLSQLGAQLLAEQLDAILAGNLNPQVQDEALVTYAEKLSKDEAAIDWTRPARRILRQVNAFNPWPVAQTGYQNQVMRIWRAELTTGEGGAPGTVLAAGKPGIDVACGEGVLRLTEIQLPGKKRMAAAAFCNAQNPVGERLASRL